MDVVEPIAPTFGTARNVPKQPAWAVNAAGLPIDDGDAATWAIRGF